MTSLPGMPRRMQARGGRHEVRTKPRWLAGKDDCPRARHAHTQEDHTREAERVREAVEAVHDGKGLCDGIPSEVPPGSPSRTLEDSVVIAAKLKSFRGSWPGTMSTGRVRSCGGGCRRSPAALRPGGGQVQEQQSNC